MTVRRAGEREKQEKKERIFTRNPNDAYVADTCPKISKPGGREAETKVGRKNFESIVSDYNRDIKKSRKKTSLKKKKQFSFAIAVSVFGANFFITFYLEKTNSKTSPPPKLLTVSSNNTLLSAVRFF